MMTKLSFIALLAAACTTQAPQKPCPDAGSPPTPATVNPNGTWELNFSWQVGQCSFLTGTTSQEEIVDGDTFMVPDANVDVLMASVTCSTTGCGLNEQETVRGTAVDGSSYSGLLSFKATLDASGTITGTGSLFFRDSLAGSADCMQPVVVVGSQR